MGMLDEAIREHFDLKRRNGADPAVVAIEEREALGDPAQREARAAQIAAERSGDTHVEAVTISAEADGVAVAEVADGYEEPPTEIITPQEEEEVLVVSEEVGAVVVTEDEVPVAEVAEVVVEEELVVEAPEQETRGFTLEESQEAVMPEAPARPVGAPPASQEPPVSPGPEAVEGQPGEEARDELEETPEFLEETPEHDRLWFERKPPRDFEF